MTCANLPRQEENRLRAKALRERSLAAEAIAAESSTSAANPPASLKRTYSAVTVPVPATARDARSATVHAPGGADTASGFSSTRASASASASAVGHGTGAADNRVPADAAIEPARKFRKFVDHDFSKMTDTKGGFLTADDDPWNKALHAADERDAAKNGGRPEHMSLKEWERLQLLRGLRRRKEGMFEPGLSVLGDGKDGGSARKRCRECRSGEIDWVWEEVFGCAVCSACKERLPEKYSLLTKTECKDDYLLTDREYP